jgi:eukaryotic-like serine/threonine-protein kinase
MTGHPLPRVDISNLPLDGELGRGGQGRVTAVGGFLINGHYPAAVKTYSPEALGEMDPAALEEVVGFPRQLGPDDANWLYENTAWPAVVVEDAGTTCGFLMRVIPQQYYLDFRTHTQGTRQKPADLAFLLNSDQYVSSLGITVSEQDRLALLGVLASALARLHDLDVCVGDLSPKNVLFSLGPSGPGCFILDCDAMRVRGHTVLKQVHTPDWEVPDGEPTATVAADACKFGLLAIRMFARDQSSRDRTALSGIDPELGRLAELSQHPDPAQRPGPAAWSEALQAAAPAASAAPATSNLPVTQAPTRIAVPMPTVSVAPQPAPPAPGPAAAAPVGPGQAAARPVVASPPPRRRGLLIAGVLAVLVVGGGGAAIAAHALTGHPAGSGGPPPAATPGNTALSNSDQPASPSPTPTPTSIGLVTIGTAITGNPQAQAVAGIFNTYFTGINQRDFTEALSVFSPDSPVDPQSSNAAASLSSADSTTTDSDITLTGVSPSTGGTVNEADITFQSQQSAGYGPASDPDQTCTVWHLSYTLTNPSGSYLIDTVKGTDTGC